MGIFISLKVYMMKILSAYRWIPFLIFAIGFINRNLKIRFLQELFGRDVFKTNFFPFTSP